MPAAAILGAQWGDEGKGKVVDLLAATADLVVRFQGGPNAGHTIELDGGGQLVLHHIPSGLFHAGSRALMGAGMVIDPLTLLAEIEELLSAGCAVSPERLHLSLDAHVILPVHRAIDRAREQSRRGGEIGTTLRGVGPAYEDRAARLGIRFRDVSDDARLRDALGRLLFERNAVLTAFGIDPLELDGELEGIRAWRDRLLPYCVEGGPVLDEAIDAGQRVLFEGAQGALLDLTLGTYPYVTSSHTTTGGLFVGSGLGPHRLDRVLGVTKAYATRVGEGPFPSQLDDDVGRRLAERGREFGATTGRPRRCGWLDLVALRYAHRVCGFTGLAVTKLDILSGFEEIKLCTAYSIDGQPTDRFPASPDALDRARPVWETLGGWDDPLSGSTRLDQLPSPCRALLDRIAEQVGAPVQLVSVGAGRHQSIEVSEPLWI